MATGEIPHPLVTIFGAGVSGLTAAHELIERGFRVQVVEPRKRRDREYECEVGGLAANQWRRIPPSKKQMREGAIRSFQEVEPTQRRHPLPQRILFDAMSRKSSVDLERKDAHGTTNRAKLEAVLQTIGIASRDYRAPEDCSSSKDCKGDLTIRVIGYTEANLPAALDKCERWAKAVIGHLTKLNSESKEPVNLDDVWRISARGPAPLGKVWEKKDRKSSNRVEFRVVEEVLAGEHGYRYFPSFYRHLFDTMMRTPFLGPRGDETGETAFDQLVQVPIADIAVKDRKPVRTSQRTRFQSLEEVRKAFAILIRDLGLSERDFLRFQMRLLKFFTSCPRRRSLENEDCSWLHFVGGEDPGGYTENALRLIRDLPQALIAMSAEETDARTHGNISAQLLLDHVRDNEHVDMTLNGPTSDRWLYHWKRYLKRQGVRFFVGKFPGFRVAKSGQLELEQLVSTPETKPYMAEDPGIEWNEYREGDNDQWIEPTYYLLALPIERLVEEMVEFRNAAGKNFDFQGDLGKVEHFARRIELFHRDRFAKLNRQDRDELQPLLAHTHMTPPLRGEHGKPLIALDPLNPNQFPLREFTGTQYFFLRNVRIGRGHVYYADSDWGLSSISQMPRWRRRTAQHRQILGQVSVDQGNWYRPAPTLTKPRQKLGFITLPDPASLWNATLPEIVHTTWHQVLLGLSDTQVSALPWPDYFHLDHAIKFTPSPSDGGPNIEPPTPYANLTPFLINLPGQYHWRPGRRTDPETDLECFETDDVSGLSHSKIGYQVSHHKWVVAGTFMATHTRLTTMEAANESGRHAVRAILADYQVNKSLKSDTTPYGIEMGDPPDLWDPERFEFEDFEYFRRLDEQLCREGLPHCFDILHLEKLVDEIPERSRRGPVLDFLRLIDVQRKTAQGPREMKSMLGSVGAGAPLTGLVDRAAVDLRRILDFLLRPPSFPR